MMICKKIMVLYKRCGFNYLLRNRLQYLTYRTMPPRRRMAQTQNVDLAAQLNELRQMMLAQQQEIGGLRAQLAQQNQGPPDARAPPAPVNQPAAPEIPDEPVMPEHPVAPEEPIAPAAIPPAPLVQSPEVLYDKFRRRRSASGAGRGDHPRAFCPLSGRAGQSR